MGKMTATLQLSYCSDFSGKVEHFCRDTLPATLPGYGSIPFMLDEDFNIAEGLIRIAGVGKIVRRTV
jgi:hypothetical protein